MENSDDPDCAAVFDFIDEYFGDRERGADFPLSHYLARYASHQDGIAREYLALKSPPDAEHAHRTRAPGDQALHTRTVAVDANLVGPYRVIRELGRGGQGAVFLAEDVRIGRRVALKILAERFGSGSRERRERFRREAQVIARLEHPGVCGIFDADLEGATPYIAMRYVAGPTLAQLVADARGVAADGEAADAGGAEASAATGASGVVLDAPSVLHLPPRNALEVRVILHLFERAARALHAAHEAGVVHRDVKPANIIVGTDGTPVVLDFGLARDETSELAGLTLSDEVFGTPAYMSPEQLRTATEALDRRTDVYSLGIALYEVLTLERPFDARQKLALFRAIESDPMPDPRAKNGALSEDVKVVLETALEKDRARRYPTALELAEDLRRIREYEPIRARPASVPLRFARWVRRHPALAASTIGTIAALSVGLTVALLALSREKRALQEVLAISAREQRALRLALERQLAERSEALIAKDPSAALALGIDAARIAQESGEAPNYWTRMALLSSLDACYMRHELNNYPARLVTDLATSPDTKTLAVALDEGGARVWDIDTGRERAHLRAADGTLTSIAYSPEGAHIACGSKAGGVEIWDSASNALVRALSMGAPVTALEFSDDGSRLLTVAERGRAVVWTTHDWSRAYALDNGDDGIAIAHFAHGGARIATAPTADHSHAHVATLWDAHDGRRIADLTAHTGAIRALVFRPGPARSTLATASDDATLRFWDVESGAPSGAPIAFDSAVHFFVFSPDGAHLAAADRDDRQGWCELVDLAGGARVKLVGHEGRRVTDAAFSPDSRRLATVSYDTTVRVWNANTGEPEKRFECSMRSLAVHWALDGRRLVTRSNSYVAHVWYAVNRPDMFEVKGHDGAVRAVAFSPSGELALSASDDKRVCLWATGGDEPGRELRVFEHADPVRRASFSSDGETVLTVAGTRVALWPTSAPPDGRRVLDHPREVLFASLDARGERVLTLCADGRARVWRAKRSSGARSREPLDPVVIGFDDSALTCARLSSDASLVAAGSADDTIGVWSANDGTVVARISFKSQASARRGIADVAFHPRTDELVAACSDGTLRFFDPRSAERSRPDVALFQPASVEYSPDGEDLLVTGRGGGGAVRVQHVASESYTVPTNAHARDLTMSAFSPDGASVLTGSKDFTVQLWDAKSGLPLARRVGARAPILCAAFSADSANPRVISGCEDGSISIWPADPLPSAKARKPRELTDLERARERRLAEPLSYE